MLACVTMGIFGCPKQLANVIKIFRFYLKKM